MAPITHNTNANGLRRRAFAAEFGAPVPLGAVADELLPLPVEEAEAEV